MPLFCVELVYEIVIDAESPLEAERAAEQHLHTITLNQEPSFVIAGKIPISLVTGKPVLPMDWDENCIPYGRDDELTIGQILEKREKN